MAKVFCHPPPSDPLPPTLLSPLPLFLLAIGFFFTFRLLGKQGERRAGTHTLRLETFFFFLSSLS